MPGWGESHTGNVVVGSRVRQSVALLNRPEPDPMRTLRYIGIFLAWNLAVSGAILLLPPLVGIPAILLAYVLLLRGYLLREDRKGRRRRALLRLRPLTGEPLRWTLLSVPVLLMLTWALEGLYVRIVPVPPETLDPLGPLMRTPLGTLAVALLAVGIAPVVEEMFFRGLIQRSLEIRLGVVSGIALGAGLFAAVHVLPWVFPLHLFLGVAFGFAVYATRSIWSGVILHTANNALALIGMVLVGEPPARTPTVWEIGPTPRLWTSLLLAVLAGGLAVWVARRLWWAGRRPGSFPPVAGRLHAPTPTSDSPSIRDEGGRS